MTYDFRENSLTTDFQYPNIGTAENFGVHRLDSRCAGARPKDPRPTASSWFLSAAASSFTIHWNRTASSGDRH